jgi:hypothetical protein
MGERDLIGAGEAGKREGMGRTARNPARRGLMLATQRDLLRAVLASPGGKATLDDGTPREEMSERFPDLGKWRGAAISALARAGIIRNAGTARSNRPAAHRARVTVWKPAKGKRALEAPLKAIETELNRLVEEEV